MRRSNLARIVEPAALAGMVLFFSSHPASAAPFAANCRYDHDTSDRVVSEPGVVPWAPDEITTIPGEHEHDRMRLDIDLGKGTVRWTSNSKDDHWDNAKLYTGSDSKSEKDFVVTDGRFLWFGDDFLNSDGSIDHTDKNRLDLESGVFDDQGGKEWQCEKATNMFQQQ